MIKNQIYKERGLKRIQFAVHKFFKLMLRELKKETYFPVCNKDGFI